MAVSLVKAKENHDGYTAPLFRQVLCVSSPPSLRITAAGAIIWPNNWIENRLTSRPIRRQTVGIGTGSYDNKAQGGNKQYQRRTSCGRVVSKTTSNDSEEAGERVRLWIYVLCSHYCGLLIHSSRKHSMRLGKRECMGVWHLI